MRISAAAILVDAVAGILDGVRMDELSSPSMQDMATLISIDVFFHHRTVASLTRLSVHNRYRCKEHKNLKIEKSIMYH